VSVALRACGRVRRRRRFIARRLLGGRTGEGAALLKPVPPGAVVYGEGDAAVVLSREQAVALWTLNMGEYEGLKRRMAGTTLLLVAAGASLAAVTGGTAAALPYTAGGVVGERGRGRRRWRQGVGVGAGDRVGGWEDGRCRAGEGSSQVAEEVWAERDGTGACMRRGCTRAACAALAGLLYQWLLMRGVDNVMRAASGQPAAKEAPARPAGGPAPPARRGRGDVCS
jgi:hypothetical protein